MEEVAKASNRTSPQRKGVGLERRSTFRASLRRMARYRPWDSADRDEQVQAPANGQEARVVMLPVVSLYSTREQSAADGMKTRLRRSVKIPNQVCSDENLSPASRERVDRLVRKLGPEVFEAAKNKQLSKRKPLETIPAEVQQSSKRRCSDGLINAPGISSGLEVSGENSNLGVVVLTNRITAWIHKPKVTRQETSV